MACGESRVLLDRYQTNAAKEKHLNSQCEMSEHYIRQEKRKNVTTSLTRKCRKQLKDRGIFQI